MPELAYVLFGLNYLRGNKKFNLLTSRTFLKSRAQFPRGLLWLDPKHLTMPIVLLWSAHNMCLGLCLKTKINNRHMSVEYYESSTMIP